MSSLNTFFFVWFKLSRQSVGEYAVWIIGSFINWSSFAFVKYVLAKSSQASAKRHQQRGWEVWAPICPIRWTPTSCPVTKAESLWVSPWCASHWEGVSVGLTRSSKYSCHQATMPKSQTPHKVVHLLGGQMVVQACCLKILLLGLIKLIIAPVIGSTTAVTINMARWNIASGVLQGGGEAR